MQRFFRRAPAFFLAAAAVLSTPAYAIGGALPVHYLAMLGDFFPAGSAQPVIDGNGYSYLFDGIRSITGSADAVYLNLESPLSDRGDAQQGKKFTFRTHPAAAAAMRREGVLAVHLANNHILDFGVDALADTLENLREADIAHAGAGMNGADASRPAVISTPIGEISFIAFNNTLPRSYWAKDGKPGTQYGSESAIAAAVSDAKGPRPLVVSFHWGAELMTEPKEYQIDLAHLAVDSGADLVVGHHPHVPQPIEIYRGRPILYSLGNFSFGSYSSRTPTGLMAVAELAEDGRCEGIEIYPLSTDNNRVSFQPRPITGLDGQRVFDPLTAGITPEQAHVRWDGKKGIIIPVQRRDEEGEIK